MNITIQAHAKINWALDIVGRRADGYHLLDMVMQAVALRDDLSFAPSEALTLTVNGAPCEDESNLVLRAARALRARAGEERGAAIALTKRIPAQAGLGGGSADCAATLRALNELWALGLSDGELSAIGAKLGADVPFCLAGGLARVTGIGERIEPVDGAPQIPLALVRSGAGLSTAEVFALWDRGGFPPVALDAKRLIDAVVRRELGDIDRLCANALTAPAIALLPGIESAMADLRDLGAGAVFMTGSGSTVVGAFEDQALADRAAAALPDALATHTLDALAMDLPGISQIGP